MTSAALATVLMAICAFTTAGPFYFVL